jgi:hypothetical protein
VVDYFDTVSSSSLPLRWEAVAVLLVVFFLASQVLFQRARAMFRSQSYIGGDGATDVEKRWGWILPFGQFAYSAAIFVVALYAGGMLFTLLAGGLLVTVLVSATHNLRSILFYRSFTRPDVARGNLWMSSALLIRQRAHFYLETALFCLLAGFLLPHLALLGGAVILGSAGLGYLRRAARADTYP